MHETTPECPRCGYDLSGEIETWRERCPLHGVCSECGFEVRWSDVMNADTAPIRGFFDHARGGLRRLRWSVTTAAWIAIPPWFWSRVGLHRVGGVGAVIAWLLVCLTPWWLLAQAIYLSHCVWHVQKSRWSWPPQTNAFDASLMKLWSEWPSPVGRLGNASHWRSMPDFWPLSDWAMPVAGGVAATLGMAVVLFVAPTTRAQAKVQSRHVVRAASYSLVWLIPLALVRLVERGVDLVMVVRGSRGPWNTYPRQDVADWLNHYWLPVTAVILAWQAWWWLITFREGWKLAGYVGVWSAGLITGALMAAVALVLHEEMIWRMGV